ncbi:MAG: OsmC family protein [Fimbriimonadaceae bacterium]|nr:OsmC family protein [Fimbriimonadaceae bacterium]
MKRHASAVWNGSLKEGHGTVTLQSGVLTDAPYSFRTRFEDVPGSNPEELIAAAHAGCFSMAFSAQLGERGITPEAIHTTATITMESLVLTHSHLVCTVKAVGADEDTIREAAAAAEQGCPISKVLNLEIHLELTVEG